MHLIQQHTFDIKCSSRDFGKEVHSQLGDLLGKEFYPKLEVLLDQYDSENQTLSLDVLNIEILDVSKKYWKEELIQKILTQIEDFLKRNQHADLAEKDSVKKDLISNSKYAGLVFFEFLLNGRIIENTIVKDLNKLVYEIEVNEEFIKELLVHFDKNSSSIIRWIVSVPNFFKEIVIRKLDDFPNEIAEFVIGLEKIDGDTVQTKQWLEFVEWTSYFENKGVSDARYLKEFIQLSEDYFEINPQELELVCQLILQNNSSTSEIKDFLEKIKRKAPKTTNENEVEQFEDDIQVNKAIVGDVYYIKNAGLVILHPFLKALFEQLDLCKTDGQWKSKMSQHKALLLSQYLINSSENIEESDLILNKILCGFAIDGIVNVKLEITSEEKEKCENLLDAVKEHWKVMSTSSREALQQTFLQREGKLDLVGQNTIVLWVEEKGPDILLEQLPWGISTIQTPWMENYLQCNWD